MMSFRSPTPRPFRRVPLLLAALHGLSGLGQAQSTPRLRLEPAGAARVAIQWPIGDGLFTLQESESLAGTAGWVASTRAPSLASPDYRIEIEPTDQTRFFRLVPVTQPEAGTVPRPESLAPTPALNVMESFADRTAFLHSSPNPVQIGVGPGTIVPERASVLRGRIRKRDGTPLAGVHVRILNHPEFGFTYSREDGRFDLVVNGGPLYLVDFQSRGYCPAQRQVQAPAQDFRNLEDVVLVGMDPIATPVAFGTNTPLQAARSSVQTDAAGSRSATILFPPGTQAALEMPDGTLQPTGSLTIRATEFTVGPNGPDAMPGPLPPTSAYTYAVELSGDEAIAVGARTIRFNQPVHVYVDNFLGMPTGALVPSAYYDRQISAWVPQEDGVVIQVLQTVEGRARVDVDGDGTEESDETLQALAFTDPELQHLAANHPPGKTLWRMPARHFTAMDYNCPEDPESRTNPNKPGDRGKCDECDKASGGGELNLYSQVFQETLPLPGIPMALHYSSARVPGYRVDAELHLPIIGEAIPQDLLKVRVDMDVAGRLSEFEYAPRTHLTEDYGWDGYDGFGRLLYESQRAFFTQFYFYPRVYGGHPGIAGRGVQIARVAPLFGNYGAFRSTISHNEVAQAMTLKFDRILTIPDHRKLGLGGWSLTPHHRYDPTGRILYLGDGRIQRPDSVLNAVSVRDLPPGFHAEKVAAASDGSLFVVERGARIYRMSPSGSLTGVTATVGPDGHDLPGTVVVHFSGDFTEADGKPASQVRLSQTGWYDIAVGPDDSFYLRSYWSIIRITPDGIFRVVIGRVGNDTFPPDGSLARDLGVATRAHGGGYVAVGPDHTVYFNDEWDLNGQRYDYVRKISPDGRLSTLLGPAGRAEDFTEGRAMGIKTARITGLGVGPDGSVFVAGDYGMIRINRGGTAVRIMNGAAVSGPGDPFNRAGSEGNPANSPSPYRFNATYVNRLRIGPDGLPYFHFPSGPGFLWKIDAGGLFQRVAGRWGAPYQAGSNPLDSDIGSVSDFTIDRNGVITLLTQPWSSWASGSDFSLRRIGPSFPGFDAADLQVASRDGSELYVFNRNGLHLRTVDTLTGTTRWRFTYDAQNLVTAVQDAHGQVTGIDRDADGTPRAIVGPGGTRIRLTLDAQRYLSTVTEPTGASTVLGYGTGGLLSSITGPRGNRFDVTYDPKGRARRMNDPIGGQLSVEHAYTNGTDFVTVATNAIGQVERRVVVLAGNGDTRREVTRPDGTRLSEVVTTTGRLTRSYPDGTVLTLTQAPNPLFPAQTRVLESLALDLPGGVRSTLSVRRSAVLAVPENPLSMISLTNVAEINGRTLQASFDAPSRRAVLTMPGGGQWEGTLDSQGHLLAAQSTGEVPMSFQYDSLGRLTNATEHATTGDLSQSFAWDALGRLSGTRDALGRSATVSHDDAGRPRRLTMADGAVAAFDYDSEGNLRAVTPPGRSPHQFLINAVGLLDRYTPPVVGGVDDSINFAYDSERALRTVQFPDGQSAEVTRAPSGRVQQVRLGDGPTITLQHSDATGQLTRLATDSGEQLELGYLGPIPVGSIWSGTITGAVHIVLNGDQAPTRIFVNGQAVDHGYDAAGHLATVGPLTLAREAGSGRVVQTTVGVVSLHLAYDERGFLTNRIASTNGTVIWSCALAHDALGRLTNGIETLNGTTRTRSYRYDLSGRLQESRLNGALLAAYAYDPNGNRTARNNELATYDPQDRLTTYATEAFTWSRNAHLQARSSGNQTTSYAYNLSGALIGVTNSSGTRIGYVVDPAMRRIGKRINGALQRGWLWNGDQIIAEVDANSTVTKRFVYAEHGTTPSLMLAGTNVFQLLADERGSIRLVVNAADGTIAQALDYDEFGRVLLDTQPGFQPFGFASGHHDPDTGLIRFGLRDYDPVVGRWTARDPIGFAGGDFSLFNYVRNDPLNRIDPAGTGPYNNPSGGPLRALRNRAFNGDARALAQFRNFLRADQSIDTGIHADALASARAYSRATRVSQIGMFALGGVASFGALSGSVATLSSGVTLSGGQTALAVFGFANGGVGLTANAANIAINLSTPLDRSENAAPTSIPQILLPPEVAPYADIAVGKIVPGAAGPAWIKKAGEIDDAVLKITTAGKLICPP